MSSLQSTFSPQIQKSVLFQILKSMALSHFLKLMSLAYALTLTNKSAIDLRIWKGHRFENTLKLDHDLR